MTNEWKRVSANIEEKGSECAQVSETKKKRRRNKKKKKHTTRKWNTVKLQTANATHTYKTYTIK